MTESPESPETAPKSGKWWKLRIGCLILAVLAVAIPAAMWQWSSDWAEKREQRASDRHARHANDAFEPVIDALEEGAAANPEATYDIDKTIRVIHQIDLALQQEGSLDEYLKAVAVQDYRDVAPKVLEARRDLMDVLLRLYAKQVEAEDQQAMWEFTSELLLSTLSVVEVSGDLNLTSPEGGFSIDRAQAQELLTELKDDKAERRQLVRDISALEKELIESLFEYSDVYYTYVQEWDQLSVLRDRAYLAVWNGDWEEAIVSAELAIEQAPHEREAHLIKAMALIEQDDMERDEEIGRLLSDYIEDHPESSAPAFLLLGVHHTRRGQTKAARLAFQQSAAYFPKQSDELTDMLDPYKMRSFLRKSREGSFIVELYKSTMLGAGYFSPDLQMARVLFEQGDDEAARTKVLDHFARRRQQQQWDFILSDVRFCHDLLGPDFWEIFPEDTYIDLVVSPTTFGSGLKLAINNRSTRTLHNATLVLALHFTDSYPGDYEAMTAPETMPAVLAHDTTHFGSVTIDLEINGRQKTVDDIVTHRAILVTDEAVTWVDTDEFKISESEEFRERRRAAGIRDKEVRHPVAERHPQFNKTVHDIVDGVPDGSSMEIESRMGSDNVLVELPRELAILRPVFRLRRGDELYSASDNLIEGDKIMLRFKDVENFDDTDVPQEDLELLMASPFGDLVLS
ncbi:MAG: hypothetical protein JRJ84_11965, partial [Deltaproteobacteria bacterium]|nr:hypothetical protein [Deltaproteobacteria bacterium]